MEKEHNIRLTSAELGSLWFTYITNSMTVCILKYFLAKTQDIEIKTVLEFALNTNTNRFDTINKLYMNEGHAIPIGFTDNDVDINAPALYSDTFLLNYIFNESKISMGTYSQLVSTCVRADVHGIFSEALFQSKEIYDKSLQVLLSKGLYNRAAYIPIPQRVEFIQKQNYLTGWFGERRPLNAMEITQLYYSIQRNGIGKALLLGFGQVANHQKVRDYMVRGVNIATNNILSWSKILTQENVNVPPTWDSDVLESTVPPFSDKLMMFHVTSLSGASLGLYGAALGSVSRRDLGEDFIRIMKDATKYAEDGTNIMIDEGWMEQPPQSVDMINTAKRKQ